MGLCKCPHRKVTNIFCYEHRVNVCEHCLMQNHPKCVVDTYRNWITDSVFSSNCGLCDQEIASAETVRLLCLHIVHWDCLDAWARSLPPTTAPAGYTCPICRKMCVFPAPNQVSPIADELRNKMSKVNWARVGLGLSMLDNDPPLANNGQLINGHHLNGESKWGQEGASAFDTESERHMRAGPFDREGQRGKSHHNHNQNGTPYNTPSPSNAADVLTNSYSTLTETYSSSNSQFFSPESSAGTGLTTTRKTVKFDLETPLLLEEEDKYRRRSPFDSLSRWLRQVNPANKRRSRRRTTLYVIGSIIGMIILLMLLIGRNGSGGSEDDDEKFNLHANPHILVGEGHAPLSHDFDS